MLATPVAPRTIRVSLSGLTVTVPRPAHIRFPRVTVQRSDGAEVEVAYRTNGSTVVIESNVALDGHTAFIF